MPRAYVIGSVLIVAIVLGCIVLAMCVEWSHIRVTLHGNIIEYQMLLKHVLRSINHSESHETMSYPELKHAMSTSTSCDPMVQSFILASEKTMTALIFACVCLGGMLLTIIARRFQKIGNKAATVSWLFMAHAMNNQLTVAALFPIFWKRRAIIVRSIPPKQTHANINAVIVFSEARMKLCTIGSQEVEVDIACFNSG
eukprot:TRINITY_DN81215_c0_g1_i1.p1 TRINITY_DN81215_c0_g1~~TRINITY_DN81215_c0_g1_i1.p1  ORF type:complete len:198 (+),score=37.51 TRINITY_DN81215_c0_g1_i1:383-976(+)